MLLGRLRPLDALAGAGRLVQSLRLGERLARPFDGKEVEFRRGQQRRPRRPQREQAGVIDAVADEAENVLFRVRVRVGLDAVGHAPRQRRDIAADRRDGDARIEGGDVGRQRAAAGVADAAEFLRVHLRPRREIVEAAHAVPDAKAGQAAAQQVERIAEHRMFAAGQVEARLSLVRVPELAALALADGVIGQDDVTALHEIEVQHLVRRLGLAHRRMAARTQHAGQRVADLLRPVQQGRHEIAGKALVDQLFDEIIVGLDLSRFLDRRRVRLFGQAVEQVQERLAQRLLQSFQVGLRLDGGEALPALLFLAGGQIEQLLLNVRSRRFGRAAQTGRRRQAGVEKLVAVIENPCWLLEGFLSSLPAAGGGHKWFAMMFEVVLPPSAPALYAVSSGRSLRGFLMVQFSSRSKESSEPL